MNKEIQFSGLAAVPSDADCSDGQSALLVNLIPEDGALSPVAAPRAIADCPEGFTPFIHSSPSGTRLIFFRADSDSQTSLKMISPFDTSSNSAQPATVDLPAIPDRVSSLAAVGNFLVAAGSSSLHFLIYRSESGTYSYLGANITDISLDFDLTVTPRIHHHKTQTDVSGSSRPELFQLCLAAANSAVTEVTSDNAFLFPFFVRYGLRMFDGSLAFLSDPVLMIPNSGPMPLVRSENPVSDGVTDMALLCPAGKLTYRLSSPLDSATLVRWKDLVSSVEIYVSKPVYTYGQSREFTAADEDSYHPSGRVPDRFLNKVTIATGSTFSVGVRASASGETEGRTHSDKITLGEMYPGIPASTVLIQVAPFGADKIRERIEALTVFRLFAEIPLDKLDASDGFHPVPVSDGVLSAIDARQALSESPLSYRSFSGASLCVYNSRLNVYNASLSPAQPSLPYAVDLSVYAPTAPYSANLLRVTVILRSPSSGLCAVSRTFSGRFSIDMPFPWYYYPDSRAIEAYFEFFVINEDEEHVPVKSLRIPLRPHDFMPGAYRLAPGLSDKIPRSEADIASPPSPLPPATIPAPSSIYLSEVSNPLSFHADKVSTVPVREIRALAAAARPLSQGQFGQFPLYAFTSEGIWAMQVSETGSYSARQPISRDVILSPSSIVSLDTAVAFISARGLMVLEGSQSVCVSSIIGTESQASLLPSLTSILALPRLGRILPQEVLPLHGIAIPSRAVLLFDYTNRRIIIGDPAAARSLIFSLKSKEWGSADFSISAPVNSCPDALALDSAGKIVSLSDTRNLLSRPVLLVSRPIRLDAPDMLKSISRAILRGRFSESDLSIAIYGSRNLTDWFPVTSSRTGRLTARGGTPWTHFRFIIFGNLFPGETISRISLNYTVRAPGRMR